jgi:hypothetical protein
MPLSFSTNGMQAAVEEMGVPQVDRTREIFCNRTLNLRAIRAMGFDMDYTLIDYDVNQWEGRAYEYGTSAANLCELFTAQGLLA